MTNNKGEGSKVTVISATAGTLEGSDAQGQAAPHLQPEADGAVRGGERHLSAAANPDQVEYEPVVYSDPGEVTEQFDHLATRDAETMEKLPQAPEAVSEAVTAAELPTEAERESLALHSTNELGYQNPEASTNHAADTVEELGAEDALRTDSLR